MKLDIKKSGIACHCPDRQMGKARRQLLSHRSFYPFDPEGQGTGSEFYNFLNNKKSKESFLTHLTLI
ncbi:hypothetical protein HF876_13550 [Psychrobacillus sp. BL-248-WT-3]|nr:hypothetical protein [Psychrobacillus sp. BL-248-WT-3]